MQDSNGGESHKKNILNDENYYKNRLSQANKEIQKLSYKEGIIVRDLSQRIDDIAAIFHNNETKNKELINELYAKMSESRAQINDQQLQIKLLSDELKVSSRRSDSNAQTLEMMHKTTQNIYNLVETMAASISASNVVNNASKSNAITHPPASIASKVPPTVYAGVIMAAMALIAFLITGNVEVFKILK